MAVDKKTMWAFIGLASMLTVGIVMMVVSSFKGRGSGPAPDSVTLTVPDGEIKEVPDSKSAAMRGAVSLDKYFAELDEDEKEGEDVSLVSGEPAEKAASEPRAAESDEAVVARTFGVPAPSEEPSRPRASSGGGHRSGGGSSARPMTPVCLRHPPTGLSPIWTMSPHRNPRWAYGLSAVCSYVTRSW